MNLSIVTSGRFADHLTPPGHPERPERAGVMQFVAESCRRQGATVIDPILATDLELCRVHDPDYVATIRRLKQFFHIAHVHYNNFGCDGSLAPFPSWAFEVLLVNKRIATSDGSPAPAAVGVDAANDVTAADCQTASRAGP